jgi:hypothetical protein
MMAVMLRLALMSLIVGNSFKFTTIVWNSFKFTTLVRISADTIRIVYEMRPCADIPSGDPPDGIRMASGEHCFQLWHSLYVL